MSKPIISYTSTSTDPKKFSGGTVTDEQIQGAVDNYFDKNPIEVEDKESKLYSYATRVQNAQTPNTLTLSIMADTHYCDNDYNVQDKLDTIETMSLLSHYAEINAIVNLGDIVRGDETKNETIADLTEVIENTKDNAKCPVYFVRGNHDDNGWYSLNGKGTYKPDEMINDTEWCDIVGNTFIADDNKPNGGYGYFDHEKAKIRVFILNSVDIPYVFNADGSYRYNSYKCYAFSNEQLNFVANALKFEDKENPNEWGAMFLTHIPLDTTNDDGYRFGTTDALIRGHAQMLQIINAYRKGISYSFTGSVNNSTLGELEDDFKVNINVDYSEKGVGDVICFVSGHTHTDNISQKVGHEGSLSYGYTFIGLLGATAFATMVVNREENTVSVFKYGDVRSQTDSEIINHNVGAINGETEFDIDMSVGTWTVPFEQFRPTGESIYNGLSDLWGSGYFINSSATLNTETLELSTATVNEANKWAITKAIPVKGATQYEIPNIGNSAVNAYKTDGTYNGSDTPIVDNIITTKDSGGYLVFCFHKASYPDYENFYIKEVVADTPDEVEFVTKDYVDEKLGDIETALDTIIATQENLIGGATE